MAVNPTELFILLNSNKLDALKKLLTEENVNVRGSVGQTLLHTAVGKSNLEAVRLLLRLGADIDPISSEGNTPLVVAASRQNLAIAMLLLEAGADVNTRGSRGMTALGWAISKPSDDFRLIHLLLQHGANPWIQDDAGSHAVEYAETVQPDLVDKLKQVPRR